MGSPGGLHRAVSWDRISAPRETAWRRLNEEISEDNFEREAEEILFRPKVIYGT
jgi:hypothetical protein